jgi:hypothetical protein
MIYGLSRRRSRVRDAVRSAVQAPTPSAQEAVPRARASGSTRLGLALNGQFEPGEVMTARVSTSVALGAIPLLGNIGTVTVRGTASAPVDRYRSVLEAGGSPGSAACDPRMERCSSAGCCS